MACAFEHHGVGRHFLARAHAQRVADMHVVQRHVVLVAIGLDAARGLWCKSEQRLERRAGAPARAQFEEIAEQDKGDDHRGGFEIHRDIAVRVTKRIRKCVGNEKGDEAVQPRHAGAERDQRVHVRRPGLERAPAAHEERGTTPKHDDSSENRFDPRCDAIPGCRQMPAEQVRAHRDRYHRYRQRKADEEAPRQSAQVTVVIRLGARQQRLQCHAAFRTVARPDLAYFRVHRAGVDRAG